MTQRWAQGPRIWDEITKVVQPTRGRRVAAIAYIGVAAPDLLPLRQGDLLVVNAGLRALTSGAVNPAALRTFVERGVTVRSSEALHGKVIVAGGWAVIGSANASSTSDSLAEAAIVTDDPDVVTAARQFIDAVPETEVVDDVFLLFAQSVWHPPRGATRPGADEGDDDAGGFLPDRPRTMWVVADPSEYDPSATEQTVTKKAMRRARRSSGPAATYHLDTRSLVGDAWARDTILIEVYDDEHGNRVAGPPLVVVSDPINVPRTRHQFSIVRSRATDRPLPVERLSAAMRAAGTQTSLRSTHAVRAKAQGALLEEWGLS